MNKTIYVIVMGIMRAKKFLPGFLLFLVCFRLKWKYFHTSLRSVWKYFHFNLKQTRKSKNPGKNFFALNNTHYNDINRYYQSNLDFFNIKSLAMAKVKRNVSLFLLSNLNPTLIVAWDILMCPDYNKPQWTALQKLGSGENILW